MSVVSHFTLTNLGLHMGIRVRRLSTGNGDFVGLLNCSTSSERGARNIAIPLTSHQRSDDIGIPAQAQFSRPGGTTPVLLPISLFDEPDNDPTIPVYVGPGVWTFGVSCGLTLEGSHLGERCSLNFVEAYPPEWHSLLKPKGTVSIPDHLFIEMDDELPRQQIIYLRCLKGSDGKSFVIRIKYTFNHLKEKLELIPHALEYSGAVMDHGMSLAELMIRSKGLSQGDLEWQDEELVMGEEALKLSLGEEADASWWILKADIISTAVSS
jgi:hypothetical protein